ncbi:MAG: hypothetical protein P1V20_11340 [Verrucomicrobiales bacterium]|nr:hypothetical protein [Verrucomicrobiales bacterium]
MFKRVIFDDWTTIVPIISFAFTLLIFIGFFIRTIRMDRDTVDRSADLALEEDDRNRTGN